MLIRRFLGALVFCGVAVSIGAAFQEAAQVHAVNATRDQRWSPLPINPSPTTDDIRRAALFDQPLMPLGEPTSAENEALLMAIQRFARRTVRDDFSSLTSFLEVHPDNPWVMAVERQLGGELYRTGHYSRAIETWKHVWESGKSAKEEAALILSNQSASQLALMYARLGRVAELHVLLPELQGRPNRGQLPVEIRGASEGLWSMEHRPEVSFRCGPLALDRICYATDRSKAGSVVIENSQSTTNGCSAQQVAALSRQLGLNYQVAFRKAGAQVVLPAVVHWKVGHYAALTARDGALIRAEDPTFGNKTWLSDQTLDEEASGYFLVRAGPLPTGWRAVSDAEAGGVWGKGNTNESDKYATNEEDPSTCSSNPQRTGMVGWKIHLLLTSLHLEDTPVSYRPPVGPPINFTVSFDAAAAQNLPSVPYSNIAADWRINWLSYLTDDPSNPAGDIQLAAGGGGTKVFSDYNATNGVFQNLFYNAARVVRTSTNSYEVRNPDGSKQVFDLPEGSVGTARKIYMTAVVDTAGNAATVQFDFPGHITSITDAIGQKTKLFYETTYTNYIPNGNGGVITLVYTNPLIVSSMVDPFGRRAEFQSVTYSANGTYVYMTNIVDTLGLSSTFFSVSNGYSLITPYGTTLFSPGSYKGLYRANWLEVTHPNGEKERVEFSESQLVGIAASEPLSIVPKGPLVRNLYLWGRNTYYWDRHAYAQDYSPTDYTKARIYHWAHEPDGTTASPILESFKEPLEHRVWFNYAGQTNSTIAGNSDKPIGVARTLEDGTTQLYQYDYNTLGNTTKAVDPAGRELTFIYDTNEVDLLEVRQTRAGQNELLWNATYNAQHRPLTITDASRQTTTFSYNSRGQVLIATNPRGETTTYSYDSNGYLVALDGPLPGTTDTSTFTYDGFGRLHSATDPDGYTLVFDYDVLNRIAQITYPDGTYQSTTYNRLDPEVLRDRAGRQTRLAFDNLRQLVSVQDPLGRVTRYDWCGCGGLSAVIDPLGRATSWLRDAQGRVTSKVYADGARLQYTYDTATGWLKTIRDAQNQVTAFDRNIDGTIRQKTYFNALAATSPVRLTYDPNYLRLTQMQDGEGTTTFAYYPITSPPALGAGRLASIDGPWANDTVAYQYDELGRVASRAINGIAESRTYDQAGRLSQLTNALGSFGYSWEGSSRRLAAVAYPNGQHSLYSYFPNLNDRLLQSITHYRPDSSVLSQFTHAYNTLSQITNWTQLQGGTLKTWTANYDAGDRLLGVTETLSTGTGHSYAYDYDASDNRILGQTDLDRQEFSYNAVNQLIGGSNSLAANVSYSWDAANRLVAITNGVHSTAIAYDGLGRRTRMVEADNGSVTSDRRYVWCGSDLCEERDSTGTTVSKRFLTHGVQSQSGSDLPAGTYFFTSDHLGSIREMTDGNGAVSAQYAYSPFGTRQSLSGNLNADSGFTGHYYHSPSQLHLALYRAYETATGRWLSRDPIGERGGLNLYAYVLGNPINRRDRLGLDDDIASGQVGGLVNPSLSLNFGNIGLQLSSSILTPHDWALQFSYKLLDNLNITCDPRGNQYGLDLSLDPIDLSASFGPDSGQFQISYNSDSFSAGANLTASYNGSFSAGIGIAGHF